jgi:hypothetical protein
MCDVPLCSIRDRITVFRGPNFWKKEKTPQEEKPAFPEDDTANHNRPGSWHARELKQLFGTQVPVAVAEDR